MAKSTIQSRLTKPSVCKQKLSFVSKGWMPSAAFIVLALAGHNMLLSAQEKKHQPSMGNEVVVKDSLGNITRTIELHCIGSPIQRNETCIEALAEKLPWLSLQQILKGNSASVYVQEPSGEPGTKQSMLVRGTSIPLVTATSYYDAQPTVFLNGVPVIDDNAYTYNAKNNNFSPLGTASNVLAALDLANIVSVEVVTDPARLAELGPLAANGAIMVETKERFEGERHVHVDASLSSQMQYNLNASIGNNEKLANYLLTVGSTRNAVALDEANYTKYNIGFNLSLVPFKGMTVKTQILAAKSGRKRNKTMRERLSEMEYYPSQWAKMAFTPENVAAFDKLLDDSKDDNDNMQLHGYLTLNYRYKNLRSYAGAYFDYITNNRSVFWPSGLMEGINYASDYSGYNRRFYGQMGIGYDWKLAPKHLLKIDWTGNLREDKYHYTYDRGFDGEDDKKQSTNSGGYKQQYAMDQLTFHTISSAFALKYSFAQYAKLNVILRQDAVSSLNKDAKWLFTPAFSAEWDAMPTFGVKSDVLNSLKLSASWARIGRMPSTDAYSMGPTYDSNNINFGNGAVIGSYYGFSTITRPYSQGWVNYGIGWPYAEKLELGLRAELLKNRLSVGVSLYKNNDKDMVTAVPVQKELGYQYQYLQGMEIENRGVEATMKATPIYNKVWKWNLALNLAHNENELKALPNGMQEMTLNNRELKVGEAVDKTIPFLPSLTGGLNSCLQWKDFDLNLGFYFATGQKVLNADTGLERKALNYVMPSMAEANGTTHAISNGTAYIGGTLTEDLSNAKLEDASFLKLRSVSLGYHVPLKKNSLYVYGSATNLFTITGFSGEDPELVDFDGVYRGYGIKLPRTFTLGCKLSF